MHLHHFALWVKDLEGVKNFYQRWFQAVTGNRYHNPKRGFSSYFLSLPEGAAKIELMQQDSIPEFINQVERIGYTHLAIVVGDRNAVDTLYYNMLEAGENVIAAPRQTGDGYYEAIVSDPEGNRIEIVASN